MNINTYTRLCNNRKKIQFQHLKPLFRQQNYDKV